MEDFYWKKGDYLHRTECYVSPEGKVCGELVHSRFDDHWSARGWNESERQFLLLGIYISEEKAKLAIEDYCGDNY